MHNVTRGIGFGWHGVLLLACAVVLAACAGTERARDPSYLYRLEGNYVRLDPIETGVSENSHPFAITADQLRRLLADINVSRAATMGAGPLFANEELEAIVEPLVAALSKASPKQDVTFAISSHRGLLGRFSPASVTTGRLFAGGGVLNLIFGSVQELNGGTRDVIEPTHQVVPASRSRRAEPTVWKIETSRARLRERRTDWLVFDRSAMTPSATTPVLPLPDAKPDRDTTAPTSDSKTQEIETRLRRLDELRKNGAITEEEYFERRRAILDQL